MEKTGLQIVAEIKETLGNLYGKLATIELQIAELEGYLGDDLNENKSFDTAEPEPAAEPVVVPVAEPLEIAEPDVAAEEIAEPQAEEIPVVEAEESPVTEPVEEPEPEDVAEPEPAIEAEPAAEPEPIAEPEPEVEPEPEPETAEEPVVEPEPVSAADDSPVFEAEPEQIPEPAEEPVDEPEPFIREIPETGPVAEPVAGPVEEPIISDIPVFEPEAAIDAEQVFDLEMDKDLDFMAAMPATGAAIPIIDEIEPAESINDAEAAKVQSAVIDVLFDKCSWKHDLPGSPVRNILSGISLNDRMLFTKTLFGNDPGLFQQTVSLFNNMNSLQEAEQHIVKTFPKWNMNSEIVYRFMMAVRRKLRG